MGTRVPMTLPQAPNQRWSIDFVSDTLACGRRCRMLAVVDDFTRECIALVADTSLSGARVGRELDAIIADRGKPLMRQCMARDAPASCKCRREFPTCRKSTRCHQGKAQRGQPYPLSGREGDRHGRKSPTHDGDAYFLNV